MTIDDAHQDVRTLIRATEGSEQELAAAVSAVGPQVTAELLIDELVVRADLHQVSGPDATPIRVQFDLAHDGGVVRRHVHAAKEPEHVAGPCDDPHATVETALAELLRAVYGPRRGTTRQLAIRWHDLESPERLGAAMHVFPVVQRLVRGVDSRPADLAELSLHHGSDKWGLHYYTPHYERHFGPLRDRPLTVLELGVGGFGNSASGGGSLRMWKRFFPRAVFYGVDLFDKSAVREPRIHTVQGDLSNHGFLDAVGRELGPFDIVVDDGSHAAADVLTAFHSLFRHVRPGGLYVVEDLQTSYWPGYGGTTHAVSDPRTGMGLLAGLLDGLHHEERSGDDVSPADTDATVTGVHFHPSLAVVERGVNVQGPSPSWIPRRLMTHDEMLGADWGEGLSGAAGD